MKALTIYQPYAALIAAGGKRYETRSWKTSYRGPIAIHAGKNRKAFPLFGFPGPDGKPTFASEFCRVFPSETRKDVPFDKLFWRIYGAVIATAELAGCWRIVSRPGADIEAAKDIPIGGELDVPKHHPDFGRIIVPPERELLFGDWTPGRWAWELANVATLPEPVYCNGNQGLWEWKR